MPENWGCKYSHVGPITVCEIGICIHAPATISGVSYPAEWVWKADGAGQSDIEAEKGALSDAFKRAAVRWGIGRYLYHLPSPWVEIEKRGRTSVIAKHEYARLEKILQQAAGGASLPSAPSLPPAEDDVTSAAKRWVAQQVTLLNGYTKDADIFEWDDKNERALHKLKLQHRDLWDELAECRLQALETLRKAA